MPGKFLRTFRCPLDFFFSVHHSPFYLGLRPSVVKTPHINIAVDGRNVAFDTPPFMLDGRTLCQVRPVAEAMGAQVTWDQAPQMVTLTRGSRIAKCQVGSEVGVVNGRGYVMDEPPIFVGANVVVPVRFLADAMGYNAQWNRAELLVSLTS